VLVAADALRAAGHTLVPFDIAGLGLGQEGLEAFLGLLGADQGVTRSSLSTSARLKLTLLLYTTILGAPALLQGETLVYTKLKDEPMDPVLGDVKQQATLPSWPRAIAAWGFRYVCRLAFFRL
jgi:hypothetical protein